MNGTPQDLKQIATHLRALGERPPTPESRQEVESYLTNKWEGLQSVAAQVLGAWGGPDFVRALRGLLLRSLEKKHARTVRGVAVRALARSVDESDVNWVLDLYFSSKGASLTRELLPLVCSLPVSDVRERVQYEAKSADRDIRWAAASAIMRMPFPDKVGLLPGMAEDPDREIRRLVRYWLERLARATTDQRGKRPKRAR